MRRGLGSEYDVGLSRRAINALDAPGRAGRPRHSLSALARENSIEVPDDLLHKRSVVNVPRPCDHEVLTDVSLRVERSERRSLHRAD